MKKACIIAVGRIKEQFVRDGIAEYAKRLSRFCDFSVKEVEESKREDPAEESPQLLCAMREGYNIVTDLTGKETSSEKLAAALSAAYMTHNRVNFVIGSSRGVGGEVLKAADLIISLGPVTYPHQLFRLLLSEQIYRAFTINAKLPYHK